MIEGYASILDISSEVFYQSNENRAAKDPESDS
jgi:hypothetical protein